MNTFLHSGDLGDMIYCLPVIRNLGGGMFLWHKSAVTPKTGPEQWLALAELIAAQTYITGLGVWQEGDDGVTHDFTHFRHCYHPRRSLALAQAKHIGLEAVNTKDAWLKAPAPESHGRPVFARSARYHNPNWGSIWPQVVAKHAGALFVGTPQEHATFEQAFGRVEYRPTADFAELANVIAGASLFVGNQSSPYAVAEGLKVPTIQETCANQPDCVYPRDNAMFVVRASEWAAINQGPKAGGDRLMLALQCCPQDAALALELTKLIADIEPTKRKDAEFCISVRRDVAPDIAEAIRRAAAAKFERTHIIRNKRAGVGWPAGPNDLWAETMMRVSMLRKEGKTACDAIFTFEPDCVPLRADWVAKLAEAWRAAQARGKDATGHVDTDPDHMNGNAIFRIGLLRDYPQLSGSGDEGWDTFHALLLLGIGCDTPAISQWYRREEYDRAWVESIRKDGKVPALFHGLKGINACRIVRDMLGLAG